MKTYIKFGIFLVISIILGLLGSSENISAVTIEMPITIQYYHEKNFIPILSAKNKNENDKSANDLPEKFSSTKEAVEFFIDNDFPITFSDNGWTNREITKEEREKIKLYVKSELFNSEFINKDVGLGIIYSSEEEFLNDLNTELKKRVTINELKKTTAGMMVELIIREVLSELKSGVEVYETSNTNTQETDISSSDSLATGDMYAQKNTKTESSTIAYEESADPLEATVAGLISSVGDSINDLVGLCDGTLDKLVYGRLVYYGTNYYCFELVKGNPYGIVGTNVYKLFKNLVIPLLILLIFSKFAKAAWNSGSGEQRRIFKDTLARTALMLLLVFLVPNMIDALIALKDIILNYASDKLAINMSGFFGLENTGDVNNSIIVYYKNSTEGGHLLDALLYLGVSFISLFYMVTYISTAVSVMVSYMFFPLIIIFSFAENKMIDMWFKEMIGNIFAPVLDAVLLLMPLMLNQFLPNSSPKAYLISFIACYAVIPSRAVIRSMLGVGGNLRSELLGFGALMGTMRMLSGMKNRVTGGVKGLLGAHKQNKADREMSDMYADLARANGEGNQLTGRFAKLGKLSSLEDGSNEDGKLDGLKGIFSRRSAGDKENNSDLVQKKGLENENPETLEKLGSTVSDNDTEMNGISEEGGVESVNVSQEIGQLESVIDDNNSQETEDALRDENIATTIGNEGGTDIGIENMERTPEEQREIDKKNVLKSYVNTGNFENKEFKNCLNFAERAKLHRQRANRNAVYSAASAVGSVAGGVGMGALGATAFGGATMFAGSRVNMTAAATGANFGSSVGSYAGNAVAHGVSSTFMHERATKVSSHPVRSTAARVSELAIREAGAAPGVANQLYRKAESYRKQPNNSTFAHRLSFDPTQTTVPQRRSGYTDGRVNTNHQNYSSPENIHSYDIPSMPLTTPVVDTSSDYKLDFNTLDSSLASLGLDNEQYKTQVAERLDVFTNPEAEKYQEYTEQLNRMKENYAEELEAKRAELIQQMDEKAAEERMQKELDRMEKNCKATIITRDMFRSSPNASSPEKAKQKFFKNPRKDDMEQIYKNIRKQL